MGLYSRYSSVYNFAFVVLVGSLWAVQASATLTLSGLPTGASAVVEGTVDGTTTTKPIVYAGFAGSCLEGKTTLATCNSCVNTSGLLPCNPQNAYPELLLKVQLAVSNTAVTTTTDILVKFEDVTVSPKTASYSGGVLTLEISWGNICASVTGWGNQCAPASDGSFSGNLVMGFQNIGTGTDTDTYSLPIRARYMSAVANTYPDCDTEAVPADPTPTTNVGFCHFEAYKGDKKIYADRLFIHGDSYPSSPATNIDYSNIVFYYLEQAAGETNAQTLARINNTTPYITIGINTTLKPPAGDNRITGLKNDTPYCILMGNKDRSGIISSFTSFSGADSQDPAVLCATPQKVVGLLDDKSCFIATAAFGSDMAPEVQSFREFRNRVLFSSEFGTRFVKFYYQHSPKYARLIAQSPTARMIVRGFLWPLLAMAKISVAIGAGMTAILILLTFSGAIFWMRRLYKRGLA